LRGVTTCFAALMAFRSNRRRLRARPGFIQIASPSEHIFHAAPPGVQSNVLAAPPGPGAPSATVKVP
jgi:hypothetical protein